MRYNRPKRTLGVIQAIKEAGPVILGKDVGSIPLCEVYEAIKKERLKAEGKQDIIRWIDSLIRDIESSPQLDREKTLDELEDHISEILNSNDFIALFYGLNPKHAVIRLNEHTADNMKHSGGSD